MKTSFRREHVFPSVVATQCMSILKWVFAQSCVCTRLYVLFWKCRKLQLMHNHSVNSENITMNCECPCKPISISMTKTNPHDDLKRAPKKCRSLCENRRRHKTLREKGIYFCIVFNTRQTLLPDDSATTTTRPLHISSMCLVFVVQIHRIFLMGFHLL